MSAEHGHGPSRNKVQEAAEEAIEPMADVAQDLVVLPLMGALIGLIGQAAYRAGKIAVPHGH